MTNLLDTADDRAAVYAAVLDSALDAVIVIDEAGIVVAINPAAETTFGYARSEAVGQAIGDLIVPDHLKDAHEAGIVRYRMTREPRVLGRRVMMDARCKDGRVIPVELAITEVRLPQGRLFTANLRDLSAARAAMAEIERQRAALDQSEKLAALGSLLAGVAHELNNPLSIVLGQAVMLREEIESTSGQAGLVARAVKIETAAERCARVVRSFLAIARQRKAEKRAVALAPLLEDSIKLVQYGLQSNGITVARDDDGATPDVLADPHQVQTILVNLIVNATQALEEVPGPRTIRVGASGGADGMVRIVVSDNGPGIPADIVHRIFDPFFTTKPQGVGTGIGLSISRGLAEAQGGQLLHLGSAQGGATFALDLPLAASAAVAETIEVTDVEEVPGGARRAIVIDDEVDIGQLLVEALQRVGYQCDVATSGRDAQALIAVHGHRYAAVICDLRMPDMDGPALFRWLESHHPALAQRTVFVTGDALGPSAARFLAECSRPVLEKPFTPADIVRLVSWS